jgi:hypothetical protein
MRSARICLKLRKTGLRGHPKDQIVTATAPTQRSLSTAGLYARKESDSRKGELCALAPSLDPAGAFKVLYGVDPAQALPIYRRVEILTFDHLFVLRETRSTKAAYKQVGASIC